MHGGCGHEKRAIVDVSSNALALALIDDALDETLPDQVLWFYLQLAVAGLFDACQAVFPLVFRLYRGWLCDQDLEISLSIPRCPHEVADSLVRLLSFSLGRLACWQDN